jgi:hypothetical protein
MMSADMNIDQGDNSRIPAVEAGFNNLLSPSAGAAAASGVSDDTTGAAAAEGAGACAAAGGGAAGDCVAAGALNR